MSTAKTDKIWGKFQKTVDNCVDSVNKGHISWSILASKHKGHIRQSWQTIDKYGYFGKP